MKKHTLIFVLVYLSFPVLGESINGTIKDQQNNPLAFATVSLLDTDSLTVSGTVADNDGKFEIANIAKNNYILRVAFLGYETLIKPIKVEGKINIGDLILKESVNQLNDVMITADMIRRTADSYTFITAGKPIAIGRTSLELLGLAPGVWYARGKGLSINGNNVSQIYVNDRELKMSHEELMVYLESIDAEQVSSIEIIPTAGAQYDANAMGGVIKIKLKRSVNAGLTGSVGMNMNMQKNIFPSLLRPSVNLDYRINKLSFYSNFNYDDKKIKSTVEELTHYLTGNKREIHNISKGSAKVKSYSGRLGSVYEITDKQNIGVNFDYSINNNATQSPSSGYTKVSDEISDLTSTYDSDIKNHRYMASLNYNITIDEKGSNLKVIADYLYDRNNRYSDSYSFEKLDLLQSIEKGNTMDWNGQTDLYTIKADYNHIFNSKFRAETGIKYTYTNMNTELINSKLEDGNMIPDPDLDDNYIYKEGVLGAYINGSASLGKINLNAGLRVENTLVNPYSYSHPEDVKKLHYTDFFGFISLQYILNKEKGNMINASFSQGIDRPSFSNLNPYRQQISSYSYIVGNPDLQPSYYNHYNVTGILRQKYSLTLGFFDGKGMVAQVMMQDIDNPEVTLYQSQNIGKSQQYYTSLNMPFNPFKWWRLGVDATYAYARNVVNDYEYNKSIFQGRINNIFTFMKNWSLEANFSYMSGGLEGNMKTKAYNSFDMGLRKSFLQNRLTVSAVVNNIFDNGKWTMRAEMEQPGISTRTVISHQSIAGRAFGISARWNFRAGKEVNVKKAQIGNEEERSR
ncbi:MAG: outer membrane beta-barrel family protein [Bacteroidales bacterium]|nr:outer membrane beta-barrel family protein [Bacteroidales bacterium]